jgi:putative CocE/NonD family hydrolase
VRVRTDLPRAVRELEHVWIPLSDGTRLAARIWLPEDAEAEPVPAILEYIPYRKADWTWPRDAPIHPYFAGHGYASVRVDLRGSGDSDGILLDEYLEQEQDDAVEVLRWIGEQAWCTGRVGMFGISWGGFNGLQVAARRPPELGAVITLMSTDDRYADDVHYVGGALLAIDMLPWASSMLVWNATPPDFENRADDWRETWLRRLRGTPPYVEAWLSHQRRDEFWQHGSVCEDFSAIECPVYAVGGWVDGYTDAVFRLLEGLSGPRKGLVGPWGHGFPHDAMPGPQIGFLQECLRWWDRWLKGEENGIEDEPQLRAWLFDAVLASAEPEERPGRWTAEEAWPPGEREPRVLVLRADGVLDEDAGPAERLSILGSQLCGLDSGLWCPYGDSADQPTDQRMDDGLSLTFTSGPLEEDTEILGFPEARLSVASDRPLAVLCVRLCDVAPDGASTLVTRGVLNLTHRESHLDPSPLAPGDLYDVTVRLNAIGYRFPAGHRLRVAVSPTYWPWLWPSPDPVTLTVLAGESTVALPVRPQAAADGDLEPFGEPESAPPPAAEEVEPGSAQRRVVRDFVSGEAVLTYEHGGGRRILPNGVELADGTRETFTIREGDPLSARVRCEEWVEIARGDVRTRIETDSEMWSDAESFHVRNRVRATENREVVHDEERTFAVPRDHV